MSLHGRLQLDAISGQGKDRIGISRIVFTRLGYKLRPTQLYRIKFGALILQAVGKSIFPIWHLPPMINVRNPFSALEAQPWWLLSSRGSTAADTKFCQRFLMLKGGKSPELSYGWSTPRHLGHGCCGFCLGHMQCLKWAFPTEKLMPSRWQLLSIK